MNNIKVEILKTGRLFHYAHFICDVLFPEINNKLYNYHSIYRKKEITQTIGIFKNIYEDVMGSKYIELNENEYNKLKCEFKLISRYDFKDRNHFIFFKDYILNKFNIKDDNNYPEILLIQRGNPIQLVIDNDLKKFNTNGKNGNETREINNIEELKIYLQNNYGKKYRTVILENVPFIEQVKLFYNAKYIIGVHGGAFANMFFCKPNTLILEILGDRIWRFFDIISKQLSLKHFKCPNDINIIKNNIITLIPKFYYQ